MKLQNVKELVVMVVEDLLEDHTKCQIQNWCHKEDLEWHTRRTKLRIEEEQRVT